MTSRINRSLFYGRANELRRCIKSLNLHDMINEVKAVKKKGGSVGQL